MIRITLFGLFLFATSCCFKTLPRNNTAAHTSELTNTQKKQAHTVIAEAKKYLGTPYKYAGNDKKGIDCSGLTCRAYESIGVKLPRIAGDQTKAGISVKENKIQIGDLVFFKASKKSSNKITHVGLVSEVKEPSKNVIFIHASTSKGVMESQLFSDYWKPLIVDIVRVIK
jgi:cell wall-associated NlpC family hydrolase